MSSPQEKKVEIIDTPVQKKRQVEEKDKWDEHVLRAINPRGSVSWSPHTIKCHLDVPFPTVTCEDISQDYEANSWVLNHLPLKSYEQKEEFAKLLLADQRKQEISRQSLRKGIATKSPEKKKKGKGKKKPSQPRKSVKELPTFS